MSVEEIEVEFAFDEKTELVVTEVDPDYDLTGDEADLSLADSTREDRGTYIGASSGGRRWEMKVLTIGSWPEVKTETCYKKVRIPFNGWTKVPYPCVWRRTCKRSWYLTIVYSGSVGLPGNIEQIIKDCAAIALIPAIPLLLSGNPGAAAAAFLEAFKTCVISKGVQEATKFSVGFDSRATHGEWKRI